MVGRSNAAVRWNQMDCFRFHLRNDDHDICDGLFGFRISSLPLRPYALRFSILSLPLLLELKGINTRFIL